MPALFVPGNTHQRKALAYCALRLRMVVAMKLTINTDGGSRGNPGPSAWAFVVHDAAGQRYHADSGFLPLATNNIAEHQAVFEALRWLMGIWHLQKPTEVEIQSDSKLVVQQVNQKWAVNDENLWKICCRSQASLSVLGDYNCKVTLRHVRREFNEAADALVNITLDMTLFNLKLKGRNA
jgi:ribonuclease HI